MPQHAAMHGSNQQGLQHSHPQQQQQKLSGKLALEPVCMYFVFLYVI